MLSDKLIVIASQIFDRVIVPNDPCNVALCMIENVFSVAVVSRSDCMVMKLTREWPSNWHSRLVLIHIRGRRRRLRQLAASFSIRSQIEFYRRRRQHILHCWHFEFVLTHDRFNESYFSIVFSICGDL